MAAERDDEAGPPPMSLHDAEFSVDRDARPWRFRLAVFLRVLSAYELLKGLVHWALLINAGGGADPLAGQTTSWFVTTIFFAVTDPVAGVGLWVGAGWGVAIWLIAALGQIILSGTSEIGLVGWTMIAVTLGFIAAYVGLSIMEKREAED